MKNNTIKITIIILSILLLTGINTTTSTQIPPKIEHNQEKHTLGNYNNDTTPPNIKIIKPQKAIYINNREIRQHHSPFVIGAIDIEVNASDNQSGIKEVKFYIDGQLRKTTNQTPYKWTWNDRIFIGHTIKVEAYDNNNNMAWDSKAVFILNLIPKIKFVTINGKVTYYSGYKHGIGGARITAQSESFKTYTYTKRIPLINRGNFRLILLPGTYKLEVMKEGYITLEKEVNVFLTGNEYLHIELRRY